MSGSGCGCRAQEQVMVDGFGQTSRVVVVIEPATKTVRQETWYADSTNAEVEISVNGLVQTRISKTGVRVDFAYDGLGRVTGVRDARKGTARRGYDAYGRLVYMEDAAGNRTEYEYDPETGRQIAVRDALGHVVYTAYNQQGRVTNVWGATYPVAYEYDEYGRLVAMKTWRRTDGQPDVTRWLYDEATGLLTNKVYADGRGPAYEYDALGRLVRRTWARGVVTEYTYDQLGQLTNINYSDSTPDVSFT